MPWRPINDIVIVALDEEEPLDNNPEIQRIVKEGKILLPDKKSIMKITNTGTVIVKSKKCSDQFKVGDKIMFQRFGGDNFYENGRKLRLLRELEINAVFE